MQTGDRIVSIDGTPIDKFDPRAWDTALARGTLKAVRWQHGAVMHRDDFEVTEIR